MKEAGGKVQLPKIGKLLHSFHFFFPEEIERGKKISWQMSVVVLNALRSLGDKCGRRAGTEQDKWIW